MMAIGSCGDQPDPRDDFTSASELCIVALSGEADASDAIAEAGWTLQATPSAAGAARASISRQYSKGPLSLTVSGKDRCFVDGSPREVGSLEQAKNALAAKLGPAVKETRASYRWETKREGVSAKLSQTNTEGGEILRFYVFRPNPNLIRGLGIGSE
jgi:hypothetical protein